MKLALIMLAAGNSRRFHSNKLLYRIEGAPMYRRILDKLLKVKKRLEEERSGLAVSITIVTQYEEIGKAGEQEGVKVLYNPHPDEGISSSIKLGIKGNREADACLFTVSDQPWLKEDTIRELAELFLDSGKGMASVSREGKLGNPCIFSGKYFPELLSLTGDTGGRAVLTARREDAAVLKVKDKRELVDLDRPKDFLAEKK